MAGDMVVALGAATVPEATLLGLNRHGTIRDSFTLHQNSGRCHARDEMLCTEALNIPQARQTYAVLGCRAGRAWGYHAGINEHHVAAGFSRWQSKIPAECFGFTGADLVRLALERSRTARQALELVTDLVTRHGQGDSARHDHIFLIADSHEAYVVEAAGSSWAWVECREVRAVSDVGLIRQDWQRLSPGLADHAFAHGWWPDDGSKLDFGAFN